LATSSAEAELSKVYGEPTARAVPLRAALHFTVAFLLLSMLRHDTVIARLLVE